MKKTTLLWGIMAGAGLLAMQSYTIGGAGSDFTGSPLSSSNCTGCHQVGNAPAYAGAEIRDGSGAAVATYVPGQSYTVLFRVTANATPTYGMQLVLLDANNDQAGSLSAPSSNTKITALNNRQYLEHNNGASSSNTFTATWTAPAAGSGPITLYGAGVGTNNRPGTWGDHGTNSFSLTLTESNLTAVAEVTYSIAPTIFPIPNNGTFTLQNNDVRPLEQVRLLTLTGKEVGQQHLKLLQGDAEQLTFGHLTSGVYTLVVEGGGRRSVQLMTVR